MTSSKLVVDSATSFWGQYLLNHSDSIRASPTIFMSFGISCSWRFSSNSRFTVSFSRNLGYARNRSTAVGTIPRTKSCNWVVHQIIRIVNVSHLSTFSIFPCIIVATLMLSTGKSAQISYFSESSIVIIHSVCSTCSVNRMTNPLTKTLVL